MAEWHITVMSEDPDLYDEDGFCEDAHQKYGITVNGPETEKEALAEGERKFLEESPDLPIYWIKAFKY